MAETKNVNIRQYNGTDFDTLVPIRTQIANSATVATAIDFINTPPTGPWTGAGKRIYIGSVDPEIKYNGWIYLIYEEE